MSVSEFPRLTGTPAIVDWGNSDDPLYLIYLFKDALSNTAHSEVLGVKTSTCEFGGGLGERMMQPITRRCKKNCTGTPFSAVCEEPVASRFFWRDTDFTVRV